MSDPFIDKKNVLAKPENSRIEPPVTPPREEKKPWEDLIELFLFTPRQRSTRQVKEFLDDWVRRYNRM